MNRQPRFVGRILSIAAVLACSLVLAEPASQLASQPTTAATKPLDAKAAARERLDKMIAEATPHYDKLADAFMHNRWDDIDEGLKYFISHSTLESALGVEKRNNIEYMRRMSRDCRPSWWKEVKIDTKTSFQSTIWGQSVVTNYVPSKEVGLELTLPYVANGHLIMLVTWRPYLVDNLRPADGTLAQRLKLTKSDIGEIIVWHELGHNYISANLPAAAVIELYENHAELYAHLQEFYADMTALYHSSAEARPVTMLARLDSLDPPPPAKYEENEPHTHKCHAIGSIFCFEVLADPKKWPHVHLPPAVPDKDVELYTIIYMYEHWDTAWSVTEDRQLHDLVYDVIHNNGVQIFRSKGMIPLRDNNTFSLMEVPDRPLAIAREKWIKEKLMKAIAAGLADKPLTGAAARRNARKEPLTPGSRIEVEKY